MPLLIKSVVAFVVAAEVFRLGLVIGFNGAGEAVTLLTTDITSISDNVIVTTNNRVCNQQESNIC